MCQWVCQWVGVIHQDGLRGRCVNGCVSGWVSFIKMDYEVGVSVGVSFIKMDYEVGCVICFSSPI